ncbi:MAG: phage antirepressor [Acidithiobacillus sp.]|nr:phage antirepressor [Acidithiobacillus sp.]
MENPIAIFNYSGLRVRTIEKDGEPWFVAKDVADILGYEKARNAVALHCKGALKWGVLTEGGLQEMAIIPERDVYRLIMRSKLPTAERFEEWVVSEVLPSIRKTGTYSMQPQELIARAVIEAHKMIEHQTALIAEMKPKADFFDTVTDSKDAVDMALAAKVLNMGIGRTKLFAFLRDEKILQLNNQPYQEFIDRGYFRVIESSYTKPDGTTHVNYKTVVYQRGLDFIVKRYRAYQGYRKAA